MTIIHIFPQLRPSGLTIAIISEQHVCFILWAFVHSSIQLMTGKTTDGNENLCRISGREAVLRHERRAMYEDAADSRMKEQLSVKNVPNKSSGTSRRK